MINNLHKIKQFGLQSRSILENGDIDDMGRVMHEHWQYKKERSSFMTNDTINELYKIAQKNGALGGKLIGAGGGGFLMFYSKNTKLIEKKFTKLGLKKLDFDFDFEGTRILKI